MEKQIFDKIMIDGLFDTYSNASKKLSDGCISYITDRLKENNGKLSFDDIEDVYVTYDGGNHPEYASGYAKVDGLYINNNNDIIVDTEYGEEDLSYFTTDDVYNIYCGVSSMFD